MKGMLFGSESDPIDKVSSWLEYNACMLFVTAHGPLFQVYLLRSCHVSSHKVLLMLREVQHLTGLGCLHNVQSQRCVPQPYRAVLPRHQAMGDRLRPLRMWHAKVSHTWQTIVVPCILLEPA